MGVKDLDSVAPRDRDGPGEPGIVADGLLEEAVGVDGGGTEEVVEGLGGVHVWEDWVCGF